MHKTCIIVRKSCWIVKKLVCTKYMQDKMFYHSKKSYCLQKQVIQNPHIIQLNKNLNK